MEVDRGGFLNQNTTYDYGDYTYTDDSEPKDSETVFVLAVYSVVLVVGLLGHGLLLAALAQKKGSWSESDVAVFNLGFTDTLLLLLTLPLWVAQAAGPNSWFSQNSFCKISGAVFKFNLFCGIYLMAFITLICCQTISPTTRLSLLKKPALVKFSYIFIWFLSSLLTIPEWKFLMAEEDAAHNKIQCAYKYAPSATIWPLLPRLLHHIFGFLVPAAALIHCSCVLLCRQHKCKRVILPLVVAFLLCWVPYNIVLIVDTFRNASKPPPDDSLKTALMVTTALGCFHACLRPLLYLSLFENFREWTLAMVRCDTDQSRTSLWDLGMSEEVEPCQTHEQEDLKKAENEQQQIELT